MSENSFEEWNKLASKISFPNKAFINGKYVDSISGKTFEYICLTTVVPGLLPPSITLF